MFIFLFFFPPLRVMGMAWTAFIADSDADNYSYLSIFHATWKGERRRDKIWHLAGRAE